MYLKDNPIIDFINYSSCMFGEQVRSSQTYRQLYFEEKRNYQTLFEDLVNGKIYSLEIS
jgi:hypothetical protein